MKKYAELLMPLLGIMGAVCMSASVIFNEWTGTTLLLVGCALFVGMLFTIK